MRGAEDARLLTRRALHSQDGHRPPMVRSPAPTAKDVLSEFMGLRGSRLSSGNTTPGRDSDAFELFTPLPTGPGMQKVGAGRPSFAALWSLLLNAATGKTMHQAIVILRGSLVCRAKSW